MGRLGSSDHVMLQFDLMVSGKVEEETRVIRNWKRADWNQIKEGLENTAWPTTNDEKTAEHAWQLLRERMDSLIEANVPLCAFKERKSDWMTSDLLRQIRKKRRLWKKAKHGNDADKREYEEMERKVKNLIRNAKRGLEKRLAEDKSTNSKPFYSYVKKKTKGRAGIGPLKKSSGEKVSDEAEMAEELNKYFSGSSRERTWMKFQKHQERRQEPS